MTDNQGPRPQNWNEPPIRGFNWGAAGLPQPWTLYHRQWAWFILALLAPLIASITLGFLGNRVSWESGQWRDADEFVRSNERWRLAGLVTIIMTCAILLIVAVVMVLIWGTALMAGLTAAGASSGLP